jgi:septal ring factor EnvC (AmiA/AmiB activator)
MKFGLPEAVCSPVLTILLVGMAFAPPAFPKPQEPAPQSESPVECPPLAGELGQRNSEETETREPQRRLLDLKGKLRPPVTGRLARRFGEEDAEGRPSLGIVLRTKPGAQVVAPFNSVIMFANDYKDYGKLLILSSGGGYHFVLAGMTKIYGVECQRLLEGEPVGVMAATGTGNASPANAGPELYFEIRENGKPIDPLPWLATARLERTSQ